MTPDEAAESVRKSHAGMTDEEIRDHAGVLAFVAASQDETAKALVDEVLRLQSLSRKMADQLHDIGRLIRQAQNLHSMHQKAKARAIIAELAVVTGNFIPKLDVPLLVDVTKFVPLSEAWPDAFTPEGSKHDG